MEDISSSEDLKKLVYPALNIKRRELINNGYINIIEEDIWNILIKNVWLTKSNVALCDIVDDILNYDNSKIFFYYLDGKNRR